MRETTPTTKPPYFNKWGQKFDNLFKPKAQKTVFRHYLGGLLGKSERKSERKNLTQSADNAYGVTYNGLHHFLT